MIRTDRNIEGLRRSARERHQQAVLRTEEALTYLMREERRINFKTVAETARVSTAWLYGQTELRGRIEQLRHRQTQQIAAPQKERASESSKEGIISALKLRVKSLEQKNKELEQQLEIAYGQLCELRSHQKENI